jgi:uncharacterized protein (DUF2235 family)
MKNLIVSSDGTWNTPDQRQNDVPAPTNVVRLHNSIAATAGNLEQRRYYHPGVGSEGSGLQKIAGGAYGKGISQNVMSAYSWLARNYEPGDRIYLFGFSRGAFTVRSLGGFIGRCGLMNLAGIAPADAWKRIEVAYEKIYQTSPAFAPKLPEDWPVFPVDPVTQRFPVHFIGVWDTVGALGVPDDLGVINLFDDPAKWQFHDTALGKHVRHARHAVAIDEMRASFTPTLWTDEQDNPLNEPDQPSQPSRVKQLWFPGAHADVGGGYAECGLSDISLKWMIGEAENCGLAFAPEFIGQIDASHHGVLHDSYSGFFGKLQSRPRNRPLLEAGSPHYHEAAGQREKHPPITQSPYHHPTVRLKAGESSGPIEIYARNPWNETGLFLEAGASYHFKATGEWLDKNVACGPGGTKDGKFSPGEIAHVISSLWGKVEDAMNAFKDKPGVNLIGTKRHEDMPWFSLVGAIANDGPQNGVNPSPDGTPYPHQTFLIGKGTVQPLVINATEDGYFYAYANDAWGFYDNNRGSVTLVVTRIA